MWFVTHPRGGADAPLRTGLDRVELRGRALRSLRSLAQPIDLESSVWNPPHN